MKNKLKRINIIMVSLMLALSGCAKYDSKSPSTNELIIEAITKEDAPTKVIDNNIIYINNYEEYQQYLSELNPSYNLLRDTIKNNQNIPEKYQRVLLKIVDLFENNNINTKNLAIFYENIKKEVIKTNYSIEDNKDNGVKAFFTPDPDTPSITVDDEHIDFYTFLHEVIHSCHELQIRVDDSIIYITGYGFENIVDSKGESTIHIYGSGFIEGQTEFISNYLYNSSSHLLSSAESYNNASDIIDFLYDTQLIDFNTMFALNANDFKNILLSFAISENAVNKIIQDLDEQIINNDIDGYYTRKYFYKQYIPYLVSEYIKLGYSPKDIYMIIGNSLKTSIIEESHNIDEITYYQKYLNNQLDLFEMIDKLISNTLNDYQLESYSLFDFIGHEFSIRNYLYGKDTSLDYGNLYFAYNWDNTASCNANILIYVQDDELKMCNYIENSDGSLTCYDTSEINYITNGTTLSNIIQKEVATMQDGYLRYYYYPNDIMEAIKPLEITTNYQRDALINNKRALYIIGNHIQIVSITTNQEGEEIPYIISDSKVYTIPENAIKIGNLNDLYELGLITMNDDISYDIDKLNSYLEEQGITKKR